MILVLPYVTTKTIHKQIPYLFEQKPMGVQISAVLKEEDATNIGREIHYLDLCVHKRGIWRHMNPWFRRARWEGGGEGVEREGILWSLHLKYLWGGITRQLTITTDIAFQDAMFSLDFFSLKERKREWIFVENIFMFYFVTILYITCNTYSTYLFK